MTAYDRNRNGPPSDKSDAPQAPPDFRFGCVAGIKSYISLLTHPDKQNDQKIVLVSRVDYAVIFQKCSVKNITLKSKEIRN